MYQSVNKCSFGVSKAGNFFPVSFYRGVNNIEQERTVLLLGQRSEGSST